MLSEAAHSVADTVTEVFLFVALKRGRSRRTRSTPSATGGDLLLGVHRVADDVPGRGRILVLPGHHDDHRARSRRATRSISYIVLAVSFVLEGISFRKAVKQVRGAARKWGVTPAAYLSRTTDTTVKAVTFEDAAALVGLVLAALGLFLEQMTGDPLWDGVSAITIGLLLLVVAYVLARANMSLLIGQSASPRIEQELGRRSPRWTTSTTSRSCSPRSSARGKILVAAKVDFDDDVNAGRHRADLRRGRAAPGRPARGCALRVPRPDRRRRQRPGPGPPARRPALTSGMLEGSPKLAWTCR